jgi:alpha-glucosidase
MTRLRGAYDAMHKTWPVSSPPDSLIDAMQTGDRLGYHPERAQEEIAHLHSLLPKAQADVDAISRGFTQRMDQFAKSLKSDSWRIADLEAEKQHRLDALARASKLVNEAGK